jgi:hypothetical protein
VFSVSPERRHAQTTAVWLLLAVLASAPAGAHMQVAQGRLIDLIRRSERVIIAKPHGPEEHVGDRRYLAVTVLSDDGRRASRERLQVPRRLAVQSGRPYAFFVRRDGDGWLCLHDPGTVLPAPHRGREYVELDRAIRPLPADAVGPVTDVLLTALRSASRELRFHAAMALLDAVHADHPLEPPQRDALRAVLQHPDFDAGLRPLLEPLAAGAGR